MHCVSHAVSTVNPSPTVNSSPTVTVTYSPVMEGGVNVAAAAAIPIIIIILIAIGITVMVLVAKRIQIRRHMYNFGTEMSENFVNKISGIIMKPLVVLILGYQFL